MNTHPVGQASSHGHTQPGESAASDLRNPRPAITESPSHDCDPAGAHRPCELKWREVTEFETEVDVDPLREALLSWLKPDAPHYHATVEKIETTSAEELAAIAGDYTGAVTHLIIEGETLSTEDHGSEIELTEITAKPAPTSHLEASTGR